MKKKLFFISFLLILVYCLSAVCAADVNSTCDDLEITEDSSFDLSCADGVCGNSSVCDENSNGVNSDSDTLGAVSDDYDDLSADENCIGAINFYFPKFPNIEVNGAIYCNVMILMSCRI